MCREEKNGPLEGSIASKVGGEVCSGLTKQKTIFSEAGKATDRLLAKLEFTTELLKKALRSTRNHPGSARADIKAPDSKRRASALAVPDCEIQHGG